MKRNGRSEEISRKLLQDENRYGIARRQIVLRYHYIDTNALKSILSLCSSHS